MRLRVLLFLAIAVVSSDLLAQDFWLPLTPIKGIDEIAMSSNPNVLAGDTALYATNAEGIFKSTNKGVTWSVVSPSLTEQGIGIKRIIKTKTGMWVASLLGLDGTMYSTNSGLTWEASEGLPFYQVQNLAEHPEGALFASIRQKGVVRSVDYGKSWSEMNAGLPEGYWGEGLIVLKNGDLIVGTGFNGTYGLYRSSNMGVSWSAVPSLSNSLVLTITQDQRERLFAGTADHGVYRSTDNGMTWDATDTTGIGFANVESIAIGNDSTIFISTEGRGVFRSSDGHTWTYTGTGSGGNINRIAVAQDGYVYAGIQQNIVRSLVSTGSVIPSGGSSVAKAQKRHFDVSINHAHTQLSIRNISDGAEYVITDVLGRTAAAGRISSGTISITELPKGLYVISLGDRTATFVK
jgi:photosystem II stability/assembly factor-like uncharacterized protein